MLDGTAESVVRRAAADSAASVSKSTLTWAIVPSARTTPPWLVPVWTLILLMPVRSRRAAFDRWRSIAS